MPEAQALQIELPASSERTEKSRLKSLTKADQTGYPAGFIFPC
jgi:hypothetical protein